MVSLPLSFNDEKLMGGVDSALSDGKKERERERERERVMSSQYEIFFTKQVRETSNY